MGIPNSKNAISECRKNGNCRVGDYCVFPTDCAGNALGFLDIGTYCCNNLCRDKVSHDNYTGPWWCPTDNTKYNSKNTGESCEFDLECKGGIRQDRLGYKQPGNACCDRRMRSGRFLGTCKEKIRNKEKTLWVCPKDVTMTSSIYKVPMDG